MSVENYLPGDLCSGLIICWRKSSGEMSPGEKFLGEKCDEFQKVYTHLPILALNQQFSKIEKST